MRYLSTRVILLLAGAASAAFAINNWYIQTYPPYNVSQDFSTAAHWEPSTGVGSTWVESYAMLDTFYSYTAAWNGSSGSWTKSSNPIQAPCAPGIPGCLKPVGDGSWPMMPFAVSTYWWVPASKALPAAYISVVHPTAST